MLKLSRSEWITTLLQSGIFLMELLFFFGITVMTDAFIQGITGIYTAIAAGMVLSGMIVFEIILRILRRKRETSHNAQCISSFINALLLSAASALYGYQCFLITLILCAVILLSEHFLHKDILKLLIFLLVQIITIFSMSYLYGKGILSFSESMTIAFGISLYVIKMMPHDMPSEKGADKKKVMILPVILHTLVTSLYLVSWGLLVPQITAVNQAGNSFKSSVWPGLSLLVMVIVYILCYTERIVSRRLNGNQLYLSDNISTLITVIIFSLFLCFTHRTLGIAALLFTAAETAGTILLYITDHADSFAISFIRWLLSHLGTIGIMMLAFTLYDGISLDYSMVTMVMIILCALMNILASLEDTDIYASQLQE